MESVRKMMNRYLVLNIEWQRSIETENEHSSDLEEEMLATLVGIDMALMSNKELKSKSAVIQALAKRVYTSNNINNNLDLSSAQEIIKDLFDNHLMGPFIRTLEVSGFLQRELICGILLRCIMIGGVRYVDIINELEAVPTLVELYGETPYDDDEENDEDKDTPNDQSQEVDGLKKKSLKSLLHTIDYSKASEDCEDLYVGPNETAPFNLLLLLSGFNVMYVSRNKPTSVTFLRPVLLQLEALLETDTMIIANLIERLDPYMMTYPAFAAFLFTLSQFHAIVFDIHHRRFEKEQYLDIVRKCEVFITMYYKTENPLEQIYLSSVIFEMGLWITRGADFIPNEMFDANLFACLSRTLMMVGSYNISDHSLNTMLYIAKANVRSRLDIGNSIPIIWLGDALKSNNQQRINNIISLLIYVYSNDANQHLAINTVFTPIIALLDDDMSNPRIGLILRLFKLVVQKFPSTHNIIRNSGLIDYIICPVLGEYNMHQETALEILKLLKVDI